MAAPPPPSGLPSAPAPPSGLPGPVGGGGGYGGGSNVPKAATGAPPPPAGLPGSGGYSGGGAPAPPSGLPGAPPPPSGLPGAPPPPSGLPSRFGAGPSEAAAGVPPPPPMGLPSGAPAGNSLGGGTGAATGSAPPPPADFSSLGSLATGGASGGEVARRDSLKEKTNEWREYLGDAAGEDDDDSEGENRDEENEDLGEDSGEDSPDDAGAQEDRRARDMDALFRQQQATQAALIRPAAKKLNESDEAMARRLQEEEAKNKQMQDDERIARNIAGSGNFVKDVKSSDNKATVPKSGSWFVDDSNTPQSQASKKGTKSSGMLSRLFSKSEKSGGGLALKSMSLLHDTEDVGKKYDDQWYNRNTANLGKQGLGCTKIGTNGKPYVRKLHVDTRLDVVEIRGGRGGSTGVLLEDLIDVRKGLSSSEFEKFYQRIKNSRNEVPAPELLERSMVLQTPHRTFSFLFDRESDRDSAAYCIAHLLRSKSKTGAGDNHTSNSAPSAAPKEGFGKMSYQNGSKYEGQFLNQKRHGKGVLTLSDSTKYDCEWKNDLRHGQGKEHWPDGTTFEGNYVEGMRSGHGMMTWPEGSHYSGQFERGRANGEGQLVRTDGSIYSGHFAEDCMSGAGKMTWPDGVEYVGQFNSNRREGKGKMTWKTGKWKSYDGDWKDGMQHGQGTLTDHGNTEYAGIFYQGKLDRWIED